MASPARQVLVDFLTPSHLLRYARFGPGLPVRLFYLECRQPSRGLVHAVSAILRALHLLTGKKLRPPELRVVPHDEDRVPDYANVQASSFVQTTELIDRHFRGSSERQAGVARLLDDAGRQSHQSRMLGSRLRPIVLAVLALRAMGVPLDSVRLRHPDIAASMAARLAELWAIPVRREARGPDPLALAALLLALWPLRPMVTADRGRLVAWDALRGSVDLVHELVDPRIRPGTSTTPAYLMGAEDPKRFLFYVCEDQEAALGHRRAVWRAAAPNVVFLADAMFSAPGARAIYGRGLCGLAGLAMAGRISGSRFRTEARALRKFLALSALFDRVRPRASIHTPFPNGDVGIRMDSGLVTSAARRHGVRSVGYQTRCTFLRSFEELFDCYDIWCAWGEAWIGAARRYGFLQDTSVIGDVNLDEFLPAAAAPEAGATAETPDRPLEIVVFPTTAADNDQYTTSYLLGTVEVALKAAGRVRRETGRECRLWIKAKDRHEIPFYENNHHLRRIATEEGVPLACLRADRFQLVEAMIFADAVVSIGFTTPGMDALLMGKPSFYYTILNDVHPAFVPSPMFVVRGVDDLYRCLRDKLRPAPDVLDRFDPYRDGCSAERLRRVALG